jgi:hypothetical protein
MKSIKLLPAALVSAVLLAGLTTQASAMVTERLPMLSAGESPSRVIGGDDHYRINVQDTTRLSIRSHVWSGDSPSVVRLSGRLLDANGQVVAEGRRVNGQFALDHSVAPGEYTLEMKGRQSGGRKETSNRYYLDTRMN